MRGFLGALVVCGRRGVLGTGGGGEAYDQQF